MKPSLLSLLPLSSSILKNRGNPPTIIKPIASEEKIEEFNWTFRMEWVPGEIIGHGSFARVNLAIQKTQSLQFPPLMAVKSCEFPHSDMLLREKLILEELKDCPNIIQCFGGDFIHEKGDKLYNLFLEYATGGSLADKVKNSSNRRLPELEIRRYSKSILKGLHYIHKNGYVHCDLKLQNILICSSKYGRNDDAKIADFGLAKKAGEKRKESGVELRGTPLYMSPEVVTDGKQEAPADVWALGCLIAEMVTGSPAWRCRSETDIFRLLMRIGIGEEQPEIPVNLSLQGKDFLKKCFVKDPTKRWTAEMLLNHPFIVDQSWEDSPSTSPRGPFDLTDGEFTQSTCSIINIPSPEYSWESSTWRSRELSFRAVSSAGNSPAERLRRLMTCQRPDWSVSDSWATVR